ncbi:defense protein l(2)34Fc-like [Lycorma delicatula]|uniref:defense protein l(2)34Fc-like n=1 Tax=Lycorma delicatula TaxID=130591 RepID=UPI003F5128E1
MVVTSIILLITFIHNLQILDGFSLGAPIVSCEDMLPQHGYKPLQTECPFSIKFFKTYYNDRSAIEVTLYSKNKKDRFTGFMAMVKDKNNKIYGTFEEIVDYSPLTCNFQEKSAATQQDNTPLNNISLIWVSPEKLVNKDIKVRLHVSFVKSMEECWVGLKTKIFKITREITKKSASYDFAKAFDSSSSPTDSIS